MQAVISHPRLVQTGLDLLEFPTILFYKSGYSTYTLRQASRRSWRIGQHRNVTVKFLQYAGTMPETCLRLMGKKLLVSLAMEGKWAAEGLQGMDEGEDILMAMARELVTEKGIGENAAAVWKRLQQEQQEVFGVRAEVGPKPEPESLIDTMPDIAVSSHGTPAVVDQLLMFGASLEEVKRRKVIVQVPGLFGVRRLAAAFAQPELDPAGISCLCRTKHSLPKAGASSRTPNNPPSHSKHLFNELRKHETRTGSLDFSASPSVGLNRFRSCPQILTPQ